MCVHTQTICKQIKILILDWRLREKFIRLLFKKKNQQLVKPILGMHLEAVETNSQKPCWLMQKMTTAATAAELQQSSSQD